MDLATDGKRFSILNAYLDGQGKADLLLGFKSSLVVQRSFRFYVRGSGAGRWACGHESGSSLFCRFQRPVQQSPVVVGTTQWTGVLGPDQPLVSLEIEFDVG